MFRRGWRRLGSLAFACTNMDLVASLITAVYSVTRRADEIEFGIKDPLRDSCLS